MRIILRSVRYAGLCSRGWAAVPWHGELVSFAALPEAAAWRHHEARSGFEVAYFRRIDNGCCHIAGWTTAVEDEKAWVVDYEIEVDDAWATRRARVTGHAPSGSRFTLLEAGGTGTWRVDGQAAPHLDGCLDVDLESSAFTNALPVHRMHHASASGLPHQRPTSVSRVWLSNDWNRPISASAHPGTPKIAQHRLHRLLQHLVHRPNDPSPAPPRGQHS
jgi:hypothetical protein